MIVPDDWAANDTYQYDITPLAYVRNQLMYFNIYLGHSITAATASIPSKYQTIVISNADKRGFLRQSKRFNYDASAVSML